MKWLVDVRAAQRVQRRAPSSAAPWPGVTPAAQGKAAERSKATRVLLAAPIHPPWKHTCWTGCGTSLHPAWGGQHVLEEAGFPAACLSAGGPVLPSKESTQPTTSSLCRPITSRNSLQSLCPGENLSCSLDCKRDGRDWVLDWGRELWCKTGGVEHPPPLLTWADGAVNPALPRAPSSRHRPATKTARRYQGSAEPRAAPVSYPVNVNQALQLAAPGVT